MDLQQLADLIERLRREAIGEPVMLPFEDHHIFEYAEQSAKVVAILKLVRAVHGVASMNTLCSHGHLIDLGAIARGVHDSTAEVYFLLEKHPDTSIHVDQFVRGFFDGSMRTYRTAKTPPVLTKKIRAAATRAVTGKDDASFRGALDGIFSSFSAYVHGSYASVMEAYYAPEDSFNLLGIPDIPQRLAFVEHVERAGIEVLQTAWFTARALKLDAIRRDIYEFVMETHNSLDGTS